MTQLSATALNPREVRLDLDSPALAATYEEVSTRQFNHGKILIHELHLRPGERVLDVGCGTGRLGDYVANVVAPNGHVAGVDPLPLRIDIAARKHRLFKASVGRAEDLSQFASGSFDAAYLNSVFHWVEDKPRALAELFRVLRGGGRLGVNSADAERLHESATLVREAVLEEGLDGAAAASALGTNHRISGAELTALLQQAGFQSVQAITHTFVDQLAGVDDLVAWSSSSSFGNFLSDLDEKQRGRVKLRLHEKLEALRTKDGIQLKRHLVFATAKRP